MTAGAVVPAESDASAVDAAGRQGVGLPLTRALVKRWDKLVATGHGADDVSAAITAAR